MANKLEYREIMRAERRADCYSGETCDQHRPLWLTYCEGDRDSDDSADDIVLGCANFPAGTIVTVSVPVCPKCDQDAEMCAMDKGCDFDWKAWTEEKYG